MFIYVLTAIFILTPCPSTPLNSSPTNGRMLKFFKILSFDMDHSLPDGQSKNKRDIWTILNPFHYNNGMDKEEPDSEEPFGVFMPQIPKITIWEFPTERRAFINDKEIFINSNEDKENPDVADEQQNEFIKHPHNTDYQNLDKNVIDQEKYPAFRPQKFKRESKNDSDLNTEKQSFDNENDKIIKYLHYLNKKSNVDENADVDVSDMIIQQQKNQYLEVTAQRSGSTSREKRCIEKKDINAPINKHIDDNEGIANSSKGITDSMIAFYEYLKWLLDNMDTSTLKDSYHSNSYSDREEDHGESMEISDISLETANVNNTDINKQQSAKALPINIKSLPIPKANAEILKGINRGVALLPVHPDILNVLLKDMEQN